MNNDRRNKLQKIYDQLEELREKLDFIIEDEQTALDNMPESMWETERYEKENSTMPCACNVVIYDSLQGDTYKRSAG